MRPPRISPRRSRNTPSQNRDKFGPDGSLSSYADFTLWPFILLFVLSRIELLKNIPQVPSTLIRRNLKTPFNIYGYAYSPHYWLEKLPTENRTLRKRSSSQRNLKTPVTPQNVIIATKCTIKAKYNKNCRKM